MADRENLLLELGLVRKSIYNFESEKREDQISWFVNCNVLIYGDQGEV